MRDGERGRFTVERRRSVRRRIDWQELGGCDRHRSAHARPDHDDRVGVPERAAREVGDAGESDCGYGAPSRSTS
jgi:hypothetical protein